MIDLNCSKQPLEQTISPARTRQGATEESPARTSSGKASPGQAAPSPLKTAENINITKISARYEAMGLTEEKVELQHLRTIMKEKDRELLVMESVRADNKLLREQLARQDE